MIYPPTFSFCQVRCLSPFSSLRPHVLLPVHYAHKGATVLYNVVSYFGGLINRGSVSVSVSAAALSVRSLHEGGVRTMDDLIVAISMWITCMEECRNMTSQNQCCLATVDCERLETSRTGTLTCSRDQRFHKVLHVS